MALLNDKSKTLIHLFSVVMFGFACYYDWNYVKIPKSVHRMGIDYAGKLKFLTFWDALIQTVFFGLCLLVDVTKSKSLGRIRDYIHASIAFPLAFIVGVTFWAIYAVDRELIFPRALDPFFPTWLNHLMHTNIMVFTLIELLTSERQYPSRKTGITILTVFMLTYTCWMNFIYYKSGNWVYPIFEVLNLPLQIVFYILMVGFSIGVYIFGEKLNRLRWGDVKQQRPKPKSKKP